MQSYTEIPSSQSLQSSLALLLNNDKTALSCSSGSAFPTSNLQVGMLCFRTDQLKLYILKDATPTWMLIADFNGSNGAVAELAANALVRKEGGAEGGQLALEKPATSTTIVGNIAIDLNGDKLRIFDTAGTNKGFYIDLSTGAAGVASKIWHSENDGAGSGLDADKLDGMQTSSSGDRWGVVPYVDATGTMEVGNVIDFHETDADAGDYTNRLTSAGAGVLRLNGQQIPVNSGATQTNLNADMLDGFHASSFVRTIQGVAPDASGNVAVDLASRVAKSGDTMTGTLTVPQLNVSSTGPLITMADTDWGNRHIHANGGMVGFLKSDGNWDMYCNNGGYLWTAGYGWLHDRFAGANRNFDWELVWSGSSASNINMLANWGHGIYRYTSSTGSNFACITNGAGVLTNDATVNSTDVAFGSYTAKITSIYKLKKTS